jgi:hypothetical protein
MFGLTIHEVLSRGKPLFPGVTIKSETPARLSLGEWPDSLHHSLCPAPVAALMARCLDAEPARRPSVDEAGALKEAYASGRARVKYAREWDALRGETELRWAVERLLGARASERVRMCDALQRYSE